jgi:hypothetical protein
MKAMSVFGPSRHFNAMRNLVGHRVIADSGKLFGRQIYGFTA